MRNASHMKYDLLYTTAEDVVKTNKLYTKAENVTKERTASTVVPPTNRGTRALRAGRPTSWGTGSASGPARSTSSRRTAWTWLSRPVKESTRPPLVRLAFTFLQITLRKIGLHSRGQTDLCGKYTIENRVFWIITSIKLSLVKQINSTKNKNENSAEDILSIYVHLLVTNVAN